VGRPRAAHDKEAAYRDEHTESGERQSPASVRTPGAVPAVGNAVLTLRHRLQGVDIFDV
jgi:hypothetical protein